MRMLTKKTYAQYLVNTFKKENNIPFDTPNKDLNKYVGVSTSLGIALEYLGDLNEDHKEYIQARSGKFVFDISELNSDKIKEFDGDTSSYYIFNHILTHTLTVREFLGLLPD